MRKARRESRRKKPCNLSRQVHQYLCLLLEKRDKRPDSNIDFDPKAENSDAIRDKKHPVSCTI